MVRTCPICQDSISLVQSNPSIILMCRGCGSFFNSHFDVIGGYNSGGLKTEKLSSSSEPVHESPIGQEVAVQHSEKKEVGLMSVISNGGHAAGCICPQCGSESMKTLVSKVTGNTMYTCTRCGYTGSPMFK